MSELEQRKADVWLAPLLFFGTGFCALVYQTVWLRELRTIFGASTPATAAVLAVFMGGLGVGSLWIARNVERFGGTLRAYGAVEFGVAVLAALSPILVVAARAIYIWSGGSLRLGGVGATIACLLLATLVIGPAAAMMGASFPLLVASERGSASRVALLYGVNTCGAVLGVLTSTFFLLERFGNRRTLFLVAALNVAIAAIAYAAGGTKRVREQEQSASRGRRTIIVAAAASGFAYYAMELVWYRMLIPLTGGTTYTFGLVLATALAGLGIGGLIHSSRQRRLPHAVALSLALEGALLALPLLLGDRVALFALLIRSLEAAGFPGLLTSWTLVTALVVLLPSIVAGYQFPLLVDEWRESAGRDASVAVGVVYGVNTIGSIAGAIVGGFILLPALTAPGLWRLAIVLLVLCALAEMLATRPLRWSGGAVLAAVAVAMASFFVAGPTAAWRHNPIAFGRADDGASTPNDLIDSVRSRRRSIFWEREGVESSVAMSRDDGIAFLVNGKSDGHARLDAGTQVLGALLGVFLHPSPKNVLVIGLGTGSSAGWAAAVPSVQRVDVVEIEPAVKEVAAACSLVNHDALKNDRLHVHVADAREFLQVTRQQYDVIFSEPSNPSRLGISSLFTSDFYREVTQRLSDDGIFLQWVQGYETDSFTIRSIYATLSTAFPSIETWQTRKGDILLVCSRKPILYDLNVLTQRVQQEPFRSALTSAWKVDDLAGVFAHYMGDESIAAWLGDGGVVSTDDRNVIEYEFARNIGSFVFQPGELWVHAKMRGSDLPSFMRGSWYEEAIEQRQLSMMTAQNEPPFVHPKMSQQAQLRSRAHSAYVRGDFAGVLDAWRQAGAAPADPIEKLMLAHSAAEVGDAMSQQLVGELPPWLSAESNVVRGIYLDRTGKPEEAAPYIEAALTEARTNPWPIVAVLHRALVYAQNIARERRGTDLAARMYDVLSVPLAVRLLDFPRASARLDAALAADDTRCGDRTMAALSDFEPSTPWRREFLFVRKGCYAQTNSPLAARAEREYREFIASAPQALDPKAE